ncbi:MAG: flagellar hook-basal body protein [Deltaproteobacteria bacterium]|nr:flagellar hook-basal body protein [Deltaproteobacteria bacterium]
MLQNVHTSLSGALAQERVLEIIANNLANLNTVGFKEENVTFKLLTPEPNQYYTEPLPEENFRITLEDVLPLRGNENKYVGIAEVSRNELQGSPSETKNPLDVMIEGGGYFAVHTPSGIRYTRAGSFSLSTEGGLVDKWGHPVLGERGNIFLSGAKVEINHLGEVYQNGEFIDRLQVHTFKDNTLLEKVGLNHYFYHGPEEDDSVVAFPTVKQGYLESSNVNAIKNLTNMIIAHRSYEAYQKAIKNYDSMMEKSSNTLGDTKG